MPLGAAEEIDRYLASDGEEEEEQAPEEKEEEESADVEEIKVEEGEDVKEEAEDLGAKQEDGGEDDNDIDMVDMAEGDEEEFLPVDEAEVAEDEPGEEDEEELPDVDPADGIDAEEEDDAEADEKAEGGEGQEEDDNDFGVVEAQFDEDQEEEGVVKDEDLDEELPPEDGAEDEQHDEEGVEVEEEYAEEEEEEEEEEEAEDAPPPDNVNMDAPGATIGHLLGTPREDASPEKRKQKRKRRRSSVAAKTTEDAPVEPPEEEPEKKEPVTYHGPFSKSAFLEHLKEQGLLADFKKKRTSQKKQEARSSRGLGASAKASPVQLRPREKRASGAPPVVLKPRDKVRLKGKISVVAQHTPTGLHPLPPPRAPPQPPAAARAAAAREAAHKASRRPVAVSKDGGPMMQGSVAKAKGPPSSRLKPEIAALPPPDPPPRKVSLRPLPPPGAPAPAPPAPPPPPRSLLSALLSAPPKASGLRPRPPTAPPLARALRPGSAPPKPPGLPAPPKISKAPPADAGKSSPFNIFRAKPSTGPEPPRRPILTPQVPGAKAPGKARVATKRHAAEAPSQDRNGGAGPSKEPGYMEFEPDSDERDCWLRGLDESGSMERYADALKREFVNLREVAAAVVEEPTPGKSPLTCIEPAIFEALGVNSLGHRLLLAKAIIALAESEGTITAALPQATSAKGGAKKATFTAAGTGGKRRKLAQK
eukprot:TRINITY_DN7150_c0_g2_i1.p1 TRINITY_DN7150_c0_g2~~TRINITY_DN7150_c0_g2_i1.p1  ORF type:complete len:704 (-),score=238.63 TRINITY_DN7150_c0_g2_i1:161-2272(-)